MSPKSWAQTHWTKWTQADRDARAAYYSARQATTNARTAAAAAKAAGFGKIYDRNMAEMVDWQITVSAPKNLAKIHPEKRTFFMWAGPFLIETFRRQMLASQTADGRPMPMLTRGYAILKSKAGQGNKANFHLSGGLLRSMKMQMRATGKMVINFGGLHPKATTAVNATLLKRAEAIRQRKANGRKVSEAQERLVKLAEAGRRQMTNQELADILAMRIGTGEYAVNFVGRPPFSFMDINEATRGKLLDGYNRIVIHEQLFPLPPTITEADIKPELRKFLTVSPPKSWKGK